jgi:hypothetical protein
MTKGRRESAGRITGVFSSAKNFFEGREDPPARHRLVVMKSRTSPTGSANQTSQALVQTEPHGNIGRGRIMGFRRG